VTALTNWGPLISQLAPTFHNLAPDVLGFGDSSHPDPAPAGMAGYTALRARVLLGLLAVLGLQRVHLVGNSMGGIMRCGWPSTPGTRWSPGTHGQRWDPDRAHSRSAAHDPVLRRPDRGGHAEAAAAFVHDPALFAGRLEEIAATRLAMASRPEVRRSHLATFDPAGEPVRYTPGPAGRHHSPDLVMHGREDRFLPVQAGYYLAEHIPNAQLHVLPNTGHWAQLEQPARFRTQVELFLTEPPPGSTKM
jgi:2-hydroxymuconate-semialdehyde hydrolase